MNNHTSSQALSVIPKRFRDAQPHFKRSASHRKAQRKYRYKKKSQVGKYCFFWSDVPMVFMNDQWTASLATASPSSDLFVTRMERSDAYELILLSNDPFARKRIRSPLSAYDPSLNEWRNCHASQCEELTSSYTLAMPSAISILGQQFFRGKQIPSTAKIKDEDQSSVSSDSEEDDVESFWHGKDDLHGWKQGAGKSKSWKRGPTLKRCGYRKTIQSWNNLPKVVYKHSDLAIMRSEGAGGQHLGRKRIDRSHKSMRDGRKANIPGHTPHNDPNDWMDPDVLMDPKSDHDQGINRTVHLVTREDTEICAYVARLVAKIKASSWETDFRVPSDCPLKPLTALQSFIEDITVYLRLVSLEDLLLLCRFDFWIQKALNFFKQPRCDRSTQEATRYFRYGSLLNFGDLIILECFGFLTQGDSNDLLDCFPNIRKNTHHESVRGHGCTPYGFAELISNSHIRVTEPYVSADILSRRFYEALRMGKSDFSIYQRSQMKQPFTETKAHDVSPSIKLRHDSIHEGNTNVAQVVKGYKWLSRSAKRRVRKAHQKDDISQEKKRPSPQNAIVSKRIAQWQKRKLERGTDPFQKCQTVWNLFSCGHNRRVLCRRCDDTWEKGITRECWLKNSELSNKDIRLKQYFPHPCSICPWHEFPAFPPAQIWMHRTPVQSLLKSKGRAKSSVASRYNRGNLQCQQLPYDEEGSHQWELVVRHRRRSQVLLQK